MREKFPISLLPLDAIQWDAELNVRAELCPEAVEDYAQVLRAGGRLRPIVLFHHGDAYWPADGWHRRAAHAAAGLEDIRAEIRLGTREDALLFATGEANTKHGVRLSDDDKRSRVQAILKAKPEWSDNRIAEHCRVSQPFVGKVRRRLITVISRNRVGKDGRAIRTAKIGKSSEALSEALLEKRGNQVLRKIMAVMESLDQFGDGLVPAMRRWNHPCRDLMVAILESMRKVGKEDRNPATATAGSASRSSRTSGCTRP